MEGLSESDYIIRERGQGKKRGLNKRIWGQQAYSNEERSNRKGWEQEKHEDRRERTITDKTMVISRERLTMSSKSCFLWGKYDKI